MSLKSYTLDNTIKEMNKVFSKLNKSNERLSTGKVINGSEDDPAGLIMSSNLKSQASSLTTAGRNANDATSILQVADASIQEAIDITKNIIAKSIQATDIKTQKEKEMLQNDINSLIENINKIARTTSFNNTKLLFGNYVNKKFQIGENSQESIKISIDSMVTKNLGDTSYATINLDEVAEGDVSIFLEGEKISANLSYASSKGVKELVDKINENSELGITAYVKDVKIENVAVGSANLKSDSSSYIKINGFSIGDVDTTSNKENLVNKINSFTKVHNVKASLDNQNNLILESENKNGILVDVAGSGVNIIAKDVKTFGRIKVIKKNDTLISFKTYDSSKKESTSSQNITISDSGYSKLSDISVLDYDSSQIAISSAQAALDYMIRVRGEIGATQKSVSNALTYINKSKTATLQAASKIEDVDFAQETTNNHKLNVLAQTCSYALRQATAIYKMTLLLLKD